MADVFNWIRLGYELITVKLHCCWNVNAVSSNYTDGNDSVDSVGEHAEHVNFVQPILVKMLILNRGKTF